MEKTFEQALRDNAPDGIVGSQYFVRVIAEHDDHLDISLHPEFPKGQTIDLSVNGNLTIPYEQ